MRAAVFAALGAAALLAAPQALAQAPGLGLRGCPALDGGRRIPLSPRLGEVDFVRDFATSDAAFAKAAIRARNVAAFYENTPEYLERGGASYDGVSTLDDISIGQMQWNWDGGSGTLATEFMAGLPEALIPFALPDVERDLGVLKRYASGRAGKTEAAPVIAEWQLYADQAHSPLHLWLNEDGVMAYQDSLVLSRLNAARTVAETWIRDRRYGPEAFNATFTAFANFNIHAGLGPSLTNLRGVWGPQVDAFKASLGGDRHRIVGYVADWMRSCRDAHPDVRGKPDALGWPGGRPGNAEIWSDRAFVDALADHQVDLLAYAFLFATRSVKDNAGRRIPGWVQLEVLNRGGAIIMGAGTVRGIAFDPARY